MKVKVDPSLQSLSGRWSKKDTTVVALNKKTGKMHQYVMPDEVKQPNTDDQKAVKSAFKTRSQSLAAWWNENKPSTTNQNGTELFQKLMAAYDAQMKYGNPYLYASHCVQEVSGVYKIEIKGELYALVEGGGGSGSGSGGGNDDGPLS